MNKYKIGIVPSADDDAASLMAIASLEEPQMTDLFVPVLYDSRERVERMRQGRESDTRFVFQQSAEHTGDECVCIVEARTGGQDGDEGSGTPGEPVWQSDLRNGLVDALVYVGDADIDACTAGAGVVVYLSESDCMALVGRERIAEELKKVTRVLARDFDLSKPRAAVVADTDRQKEEWEEKDEELGAFLYGPFLTETFFDEEQQMYYDVMLAFDHATARRCFREAAHAWGVCLAEDTGGKVMLYPAYNTQPMGEDAASFNSVSLNRAIYAAVDVLRNRERYDEGHASPLPKLFFEKKDERRGNNNLE